MHGTCKLNMIIYTTMDIGYKMSRFKMNFDFTAKYSAQEFSFNSK